MSSSSKRWLHEHFNDEYVKKAKAEGYPSRAAYKLLELQEKDKFLKPGMTVVDLGAAPGGWSMVATKIVGNKGRVVALDILPMKPIEGVDIMQGDFTEAETLNVLMAMLDGKQVDVVLSDMAPNMSGNKSVDQPRSMYLLELAWDCAQAILRPNGCFLAKIFNGEGVEQFIRDLRGHFKTVKCRKPKASRSRSAEVYVYGVGFRH